MRRPTQRLLHPVVQAGHRQGRQGPSTVPRTASPRPVAGDNPDLIIVAKTGQDSAVKVVDSLRQLEVPVLVIDYGSHSWQDVTKTLGQATGRQAKADSVIKDYTTKAEKAKSAIAVPQGKTSVFTVPGRHQGANAFTEEAPQVQLLKDLGFTIATVPDSVKGDQSMGDRKDIVQLSPENVQAGHR